MRKKNLSSQSKYIVVELVLVLILQKVYMHKVKQTISTNSKSLLKKQVKPNIGWNFYMSRNV